MVNATLIDHRPSYGTTSKQHKNTEKLTQRQKRKKAKQMAHKSENREGRPVLYASIEITLK